MTIVGIRMYNRYFRHSTLAALRFLCWDDVGLVLGPDWITSILSKLAVCRFLCQAHVEVLLD